MDRLSSFDLVFLRLESADRPCHFAVLVKGVLTEATRA